MKETKILKTLSRKEVEDYEFGSLIKMVNSYGAIAGLWLAEKETVIADRYLVQDCGYYIVIRTDVELVNEFYYETLVEACDAFNKVADMIKK